MMSTKRRRPGVWLSRHVSTQAKRHLADLVSGEVAPRICDEAIELKWRGLVDGKGRPTPLAMSQAWL